MQKRTKNLFLTIFKLALAFGLVAWMIESGRLDFNQLRLFFDHPVVLVITVVGWFVTFIGFGCLRWYTLLRGMQLDVQLRNVMQLHYIGMFFNATMPGAVGGDIIKAVYVIRDQEQGNKTPAMLTILLDRVIGVMGLFILGLIAVSLKFEAFWNDAQTRPLVLFIFAMCLLTVAFYTLVFINIPPEKDWIYRFVSMNVPGFKFAKKIYSALLVYRADPFKLVIALFLTLIVQSMLMSYFILITTTLNEEAVNLFDFAAIYPIGVFTTALPMAPGGLGVGHVAFEKLFELIHLKNGANVFNIFFLGNIVMSMTGIIPYLLIGKKRPIID